MPGYLNKAVFLLDSLNEYVGRSVAWLTVFMVIVTFAVAVLRYVFDLGWIAMQESVTYLHATVFMLGAAYTFKNQGHVRVDVFYRTFGIKGQALVDIVGGLLLLMPVTVYILWSSWDYVGESWRVFEGSREAGGLPMVFLLKTTIPLMAALLLLQGVADIIRKTLVLSGVEQSDTEIANDSGEA